MKEKIHISKEEAKKEIDDLIKSTKEKESKEEEENLSVSDSILGGLVLALFKFWESIGDTGRSILTIIFLLFILFAVFFGGSRHVEY